MTTSDEDGNENDTRLNQVPQVRIIREEQQRGLIHLNKLCPQVMHFVNRILHIQAAAQPPTPADKLARSHRCRDVITLLECAAGKIGGAFEARSSMFIYL